MGAEAEGKQGRQGPILRVFHKHPGLVMTVWEIGDEAGFDMSEPQANSRVSTAISNLARAPEMQIRRVRRGCYIYHAPVPDDPEADVARMNGAGASPPGPWRPASWRGEAEEPPPPPAPAAPASDDRVFVHVTTNARGRILVRDPQDGQYYWLTAI